MSDEELAARRKLSQDLRYWKNFAFSGFATGVLDLEAAVQSLSTPDPCIYARQDYSSRWLICKIGSQFKAMFHTAGVWSGSSHLDTGNYVPEGQVPPTQISEGRIQRNASNRCQIDYTIDTRYDKTLFGVQAKFEELVTKNKEFNKSCKPRRSWQKGDKFDNSFTFSAQVFVRPYAYNANQLKNPPYTLHPWVRDAIQPKTGKQEYYANPHRPELWDCRSGTMVRIDKADPPFLQKGDIVWISFHAEFIIGQNTWAPQLTPKHIIRVDVMPSILISAIDSASGDAAVEKEPEYNIQEGATFLMNRDYPMRDEALAGGAAETASASAVAVTADSGNHDARDGAPERKSGQTELQDKTRPETAAPPPITQGDSEGAVHRANLQNTKVEHTDRDIYGSDGSLTPPPASPKSTTPPRWSLSPTSKKPDPRSVSGESKDSQARGTKRGHGDVADGEVAQPTKKARQTGTRRARNA